MTHPFIDHFRRERLVLLHDDRKTPHRSVLVTPGLAIEETLVNRLLTLGGGHLYVAVSQARAKKLALQRMGFDREQEENDPSQKEPGYVTYVSVEAKHGVTTGISAADRAKTICAVSAVPPCSDELISPGHIFPVQPAAGILGHIPAAALALGVVSTFPDAVVFCEVLDSSGSFTPLSAVHDLARKEGIALIGLAELESIVATHQESHSSCLS